jgi:hypothetical protein
MTEEKTHRQHGDRKSLLVFLQNKKSTLKRYEWAEQLGRIGETRYAYAMYKTTLEN